MSKRPLSITLVATSCPCRKATVRAKRWAKIKTGMTSIEARKAGVPLKFLKNMRKAGHIKLAAVKKVVKSEPLKKAA